MFKEDQENDDFRVSRRSLNSFRVDGDEVYVDGKPIMELFEAFMYQKSADHQHRQQEDVYEEAKMLIDSPILTSINSFSSSSDSENNADSVQYYNSQGIQKSPKKTADGIADAGLMEGLPEHLCWLSTADQCILAELQAAQKKRPHHPHLLPFSRHSPSLSTNGSVSTVTRIKRKISSTSKNGKVRRRKITSLGNIARSSAFLDPGESCKVLFSGDPTSHAERWEIPQDSPHTLTPLIKPSDKRITSSSLYGDKEGPYCTPGVLSSSIDCHFMLIRRVGERWVEWSWDAKSSSQHESAHRRKHFKRLVFEWGEYCRELKIDEKRRTACELFSAFNQN